ncbi:hypothetical protein RFI_13538 [Reticulomyxa filosa]|uniref:Aspartate racemase n=1 Tax=Reticulomyxa filosa TaxID=46433 RepID=X6NCM0_RETFI|nr:hypothetical protein RFI_13538 [Reticulomyxa filosa]|eukprot:ETO23643.1 hypothetical protein RFI_13538 [Reticulomyxa filosa]
MTKTPVDVTYVFKNMKTVGILEGISHQSGEDYFKQINAKIQKALPWKHAGNTSKLLMYCVNLEEYVSYLSADRMDLVSSILCDGAMRLYRAGADFLVIASNTGHIAIPRIEEVLPHFPYLHIADCCALQCLEKNIKKVALIGTKYTMQKAYIKDRLKLHGLTVLTPKEAFHEEMERIIEKELSFGKFLDKSRKWMVQDVIQSELVEKQGAQACIFGCTEIGLLIQPSDVPNILIVGSAQAHIDAIVDIQLGKKNVWDFSPHFKSSPLPQLKTKL